MKLLELLKNQNIKVQLMWDDHKIEFSAVVIECGVDAVYITPYIHNGKELALNVTSDTGVVCNLYANDVVTNKRISWKGIELTTVYNDDKLVYCIKSHGFNNDSHIADRRDHERIVVEVDANVMDEKGTESVTIHDISDNGLGIYAHEGFMPVSRQLTIYFSDHIGERIYNFKLNCDIARIVSENGNLIIGCRLLEDNREYQVYELLKRLNLRYKNASEKNNDKKSEENICA